MDKKNIFLGVSCLVAAFVYQFYSSTKAQKEQDNAAPIQVPQATENRNDTNLPSIAPSLPATLELNSNTSADKGEISRAETSNLIPEETKTLSNEFIEVVFSNWGGAIKEIRLKQYKKINIDSDTLDDGTPNVYVINDKNQNPALGLTLSAKGFGKTTLPYLLINHTTDSISFERKTQDLTVRRTYKISIAEGEQDPYQINHTTTLVNLNNNPLIAGRANFNVGTARPVDSDKMGQYLTAGYYDGKEETIFGSPDAIFTSISAFKGSSGILGMGASNPKDIDLQNGPIYWSSVKNQFFTSVLTPKTPANSGSSAIALLNELDKDQNPKEGIAANLAIDLSTLTANETKEIEMSYFVGPKEYKRLDNMGGRQDLVMQFGFFGFFAKVLLGFMKTIQAFVGNWGVAIVIMTICIKLIFWPLTAKASKSQKGMQKIQAPLQEIRAKHKDNPKKLQQETVKLFKQNGVNPAAGCLPILIQIPIFLGLFGMLRTASELRFAEFLWISDLSQPDTVAELPIFGGFPINIMPLFMGITMVVQMRMMPTPAAAGGVNNEMAEMQQKMFKFMPFIFLIFLYNFSSGLVVYWTVQNLLTILQQYLTNKKHDDTPVVLPTQKKKAIKSKSKK